MRVHHGRIFSHLSHLQEDFLPWSGITMLYAKTLSVSNRIMTRSRGGPMRTVGLLPHEGKAEALEATGKLAETLDRAGLAIRIPARVAERLGRTECGFPDDSLADGLDLAISLGGDGALLRAARRVYPRQTPLFGVNFGHLGFLAEVGADQLTRAVERILAGDYRLEERLMVSARCGRDGAAPIVGLNDAVIAKGGRSRMISLEIVLNGVSLTEYRADGLIVATPTGSTAYSLSAGGPILHPGLSVLVVTPVCAHSLHARPLVIGANDGIAVKVLAPHDEVLLVADGQEAVNLEPGETIQFGKAEVPTRLVRFGEHGFYDVLCQRLKEGKI